MKKGLCSLLATILLFSLGSVSNLKVNAASVEVGASVSSTNASTQVWTSDSLTKIFQSTPFDSNASQNLKIIAAKNEYRSGQIVIRSDHPLSDVQVTPSHLVGPSNFTLSNVSIHLIEYLKIRRHSDQIDPGEVLYPSDPSSMMYPDPLLPTSQLAQLPANTTQPFWYKVFVPSNAPAGDYYGTVQIDANQEQYTVNVHLRVYDVTVPPLDSSDYMVDNWLVSAGWAPHGVQGINDQYGIEQWSPEWWTLMDRFSEYMADHRNNVLWISPMAFLQKSSSIDVNGNIVFNWSDFDRFVQMFKDTGAGKYLHGVSLLLAKNADDRFLLSILENENGIIKQNLVTVDDPKAAAWLAQYLPALAQHLQQKGWLDTYIQSGGDEPRSNQDNADNNWLYAKIHTLGSIQDGNGQPHGMKTADAQVIKQEQSQAGLNVFIVKQDVFDLNESFHKNMQSLGKQLWLYICNYPQGKYLNRLHDMHLTKTLLPHWYTFKNGMTGYLHYGFNIWAPEPMSIGKGVEVSSETGLEYWAPSRATDGIVSASTSNLGWSSKANATPNAEEYITINLGKERTIDKVALMPRIDGNNFGYGFPVDFTIETFNAASSTWTTKVTKVGFPKPVKATYVTANTTFAIPEALTQFVRVKASKLSCGSVSCGNYHMQLSEFEITGKDDVIHESDYGSPGDAWLVYPDKVNLDVMSSMRSEVQLEGIQDYELLKLLEEQGKGDWAQNIVGSIISSGTEYNREADDILAARKEVLDLLTDQNMIKTLVDPLEDMSRIFERSTHVGIDYSNPGIAGGDGSRLARTGDAGSVDQSIVYYRPGIWSFQAQFYSDSTANVEILGSSDNMNWTPVSVQTSGHTATQNGWFGFTVSSSQVPQGTDYLKIVLKGSNANTWAPQIGEVTIQYGLDRGVVQTYLDPLNNMSGLYSRSAQLGLDASNPIIANGDGSRLARYENSDQYFVYNKPFISEFEVKIYSDTTTKMELYASPDNQTWTLVSTMDKDQAPTAVGWLTTTRVANNIPLGTHFMKVVILGTNTNSWAPQVGEVRIKYGHEVLAPN